MKPIKDERVITTRRRSSMIPVLLATAVLLLVSCVREFGSTGKDDDEETLVTVSLSVPSGTPASRALSEADEVAVENIVVLLFHPTTDKFLYRAIGSHITTGSPTSRKSFEVKLSVGTFNAVVLANVASLLVDKPLQPGITTRADILDNLVIELPAGTPWTGTALPMWGYHDNLVITATPPVPAAEIAMTRAVARVDVSVLGTIQGDFTLTDVYLYNYNRAGTLAPGVVPGASYNTGQWNGSKATGPHLPATLTLPTPDSPDPLAQEGPLAYTATGTPPNTAVTRQIYTFEAAAGTSGTLSNTCLVIGGYYTGDAFTGNNTARSYYRVEFASGATPTFLALLRNHHYNVVIREVNGPGYPSKEDAYTAKPVNLVAEITAWDDGELNEVVFGQYQLSVDKSALKLFAEGTARSLLVYTDYPEGWTVKEADLPEWLTITVPAPVGGVASGAAGATTTLTLEADAGGTLPRSVEFYIVAGNLRKKITVTQDSEEEFSLEVRPAGLRFYKTPPTYKQVDIYSYGAGTSPLAHLFSDAGEVTWWKSGYGVPVTTNTGPGYIQLQPTINNDMMTRHTTVTVEVSDPGDPDRKLSRSIPVTQLDREMIHDLVPANPYPTAAGDYTFTLVSEEPWRLGIDTNPGGMMTLPATEDGVTLHPAAPVSCTYTFTLAGLTNGYAAREAIIRLYSPDLPAAGIPYPIVQGIAPYINITDPANKVIDFSNGTSARAVTFKTNAGWKFSTDANFSKIVTGAASQGSSIIPVPVDNGVTGNHTGGTIFTDIHEGSVVFTPASGAEGLSGGEHETVVTFSTVNGGAAAGAPVGYDYLTLKRNVVVIWNFLSSSPASNANIAAKGDNVTLSAETNVNWWGQLGDDTGTRVIKSVTAYTSSSTLVVPVPPRPTDDEDSWTAGNYLTTTINAGHGTTTGETISILQPPYNLSVTAVNGSTGAVTGLVAPGGTINVTFSTNALDYYIRFKSNGNWIGDEQHFTTGGTPASDVHAVSYPLNDLTVPRNLEIWNARGDQLWAGTITQGVFDGFWYLKVVNNANYTSFVDGTYECPQYYTKLYADFSSTRSYTNGKYYYITGMESGGFEFGSYVPLYTGGTWPTGQTVNKSVYRATGYNVASHAYITITGSTLWSGLKSSYVPCVKQ